REKDFLNLRRGACYASPRHTRASPTTSGSAPTACSDARCRLSFSGRSGGASRSLEVDTAMDLSEIWSQGICYCSPFSGQRSVDMVKLEYSKKPSSGVLHRGMVLPNTLAESRPSAFCRGAGAPRV